jgi:hypothetical protein
MTEAEFRSLYQRLRDELPWGADDRRGALNYITAAEVLGALGEITMGRGVSGAGEPGVRRRGGGWSPAVLVDLLEHLGPQLDRTWARLPVAHPAIPCAAEACRTRIAHRTEPRASD